MKRIIVFFTLFSAILIFSQKNEKYLPICYSSICCGTSSQQPVADFIKNFEKKNKLKNLEVWKESGLGKEGEYCLYVGIDVLNKIQYKKFVSGLKKVTLQENEMSKKNSKGSVNIDYILTTKTDLIKKLKNPSTRMSSLKIYKFN